MLVICVESIKNSSSVQDVIKCFNAHIIMAPLPSLLLLLLLHVTLISSLKLTVLHTNDLHSRFDEITVRGSACRDKDRAAGKCFGGVARIKKMADEVREAEENVVMLNAGDFFQVREIQLCREMFGKKEGD